MNRSAPSDWRWLTIQDIAATEPHSLVGNTFGSKLKASEYVSSGVPVLRGNNLGGPDRFNTEGTTFVTEEKADELRSQNAVAGDIVFTQQGSVGQVGIIPEDSGYRRWVVSQSQMKLRTNPAVALPLYVYFWFRQPSVAERLQGLAVVTGVPHINLGILRSFPILLPPIGEQKEIASILGALDDKIELNRHMNETLEAMARALFKSWLVDFDPVLAKAEGRQPAGMDAETAALFPDGFEESALGEIPRGWRIGDLVDVADIVMGQSPPGETYNETGDGFPFYQGTRDFGVRFPTRRVYCTAPTRFAERGDVLLSVRAPVGNLNVAAEHCAIGRGVAALRSSTAPHGFLYYLLLATAFGWQKFEAEGTVFGSVSKQDVSTFQVIIPERRIQSRFGEVVQPLDGLIESNEWQSRTLAAIRDALLLKLLSGEIRVREAEKVTGAMV